jgi:hypothetical protein
VSRVFVLGTGRCGTLTLSKAFAHATNYTVGHESRANRLEGRLRYPDNHIEVDGRLSWFVGSLVQRYPDAKYLHLVREKAATVDSMVGRQAKSSSMLAAFGDGIVTAGPDFDRETASSLVYDTINDNIALLARQSVSYRYLELENLDRDFASIWTWVNATGDYASARKELSVRHNARGPRES